MDYYKRNQSQCAIIQTQPKPIRYYTEVWSVFQCSYSDTRGLIYRPLL